MNRPARFYLNKIHTLFEMVMRRPSPTNVPVYCLHEPTTGCNLKCPACPTGVGVADLKETATLDDYEQVLKEFGAYLDVYYLFNWGEPTMHRELTGILNRLRNEPFRVHMSSNFSVPLKDEVVQALANMPNLNLRINVDGATQESHEKYRVNSKLATILDNATRLSVAMRTAINPLREVYFGFLAFDYNKDEFNTVQDMAHQLGFGAIKFDNPLVADQALPENGINIEQEIGCTWLYSSVSPSPRLSKIAPCCGVWDEAQMSPRQGSLHETFMREPLYMQRRTYDAEFAKRPNAERMEQLRANLKADVGMALKQKGGADACEKCTMGKSYQNKLPALTAAAIGAYAALTRTDAATAQGRLFSLLGRVVQGSMREAVIAALEMPPAGVRTDADYRPFMKLLVSA